MSIRFFGLDGEMSGADLHEGGRLIQIGVAALPGGPSDLGKAETFASLLNPGEMSWELEAEAVHGYSMQEVQKSDSASSVDEALYDWMLANGASPKRRDCIAVGFNVGSFDLPHLHEVLPKTASLFSRRSVDLNALCFTLDGLARDGEAMSWEQWKQLAKSYAITRITTLGYSDGAPHDAGYDALIHLYGWQFLRSVAQGQMLPVALAEPEMPFSEVIAKKVLSRFDLEEASRLSGVPATFIVGWSRGGRATRPEWVDALAVLAAQVQ